MKVIAKISRTLTNPALGYIKPMYKYDDNFQKYIEVNDSMFPNDGEIFIYGGFSNIQGEIQFDELFELSNINKNEVSYDPGAPKSCYWSASAASFRHLLNTEFIPVRNAIFDYDSRIVKDIDNNYNFYEPFFINSSDFIYGPFNYSDGELFPVEPTYFENENNPLEENTEDILREHKDCIFKYSLSEISGVILNNYITSLSELLNITPAEVLYFGTKESLINWGKSIFKSKFSEQESQILNKLKDVQIPSVNKTIEKQKLKRLFTYINETNSWLNIDIPRYLNDFFKGKGGEVFINKYLEDNRISFFETFRKDEISDIDAQVVAKKEELEGLKHQINDLEKKLVSDNEKVFEGIGEADKSTLKSIIQNVELRESVIKHVSENRNLNEISTLISLKEGERNYLSKHIDELKDKQNTIEQAIHKAKETFFNDTNFAQKVMEAKIYTDLINNVDPRDIENDSIKTILKPEPLNLNDKNYDTTKSFVLEIQSRLNKINRSFSYNDIANYLITINQNFLVVFAGLPGVGKTSLSEKLGKALGCFDNKRFLKIAVSRGWTSSKDLIGYFNPLTKRYQSSKTGLLEALRYSENDSKAGRTLPNLILLDEANLSSIEHYWSDFLSLSDNEYTKTINITDSNIINFGEGVRFLATINFDHTTEVLSNRLISRAPIIKLTNNSNYNHQLVESNQELFDIFSMDKINTFLSPKSNKEYFRDDIKNKFETIVKTLEEESLHLGNPTVIGYRKYNAVERYCKVAGIIMEDETKFTALDYAINQIILPLINGRGENYGKRLHSLFERLQGLPMSSLSLEKIIRIGDENFKNYSYFC